MDITKTTYFLCLEYRDSSVRVTVSEKNNPVVPVPV
ncbi:hypothetical protein T11_16270 [Trichinella zimbabwensis]|uniref:Uncharacterized protein n=1 Tax=Trichinella zimbabwensis TaxID=268475 RepID=A0A0V1GAW3_9BILA|nr:hypothetical protein T11_16270 [Trichinella zimbabwensis]